MVLRTPAPFAAVLVCAGLIGAAVPAAAAPAVPAAQSTVRPMAIGELADWVVRTGDNDDLPFAIVDKTTAMVFVYDARGKTLGAGAALVGLTPGDESVPGIGDRQLSEVAPEERTTPAGRFVGGFGPAADGSQVLWVDFDTAVSMHPVITTHPEEHRMERLLSPTPDDNRISYGCINVANDFYDHVVRPTFEENGGVFYVLPDTRAFSEVFPDVGMRRQVKAVSPKPRARHRLFGWW